MENRLKVMLYNAISLLVDETIDQFDSVGEWLDWICNEIDCSIEELEKCGISIRSLNLGKGE